MKKFLISLLLLLSLMQISIPVYADINNPAGSPADSDWSANLYNPANGLSPNNPDNQNNSDDEEYTYHGSKKQPSFLEVIFGIITAAGFLGLMYYLIFYFVLHDKESIYPGLKSGACNSRLIKLINSTNVTKVTPI